MTRPWILMLALVAVPACDGETESDRDSDTAATGAGKADGAQPCCDLADDPGGPEGSHCCADGTWLEDIGSNDPTLCDPLGGLGEVCE